MNLPEIHTNTGETLSDLSQRSRMLIVFLRHFGCTFSRETMTDLACSLSLLASQDIQPILVHTAAPDVAEAVFGVYDLQGVPHISDPERKLYQVFGLGCVRRSQLFSFKNIGRSLVAGVLKGHWIGRVAGDPYQLPGVFIFKDNRILNTYTYRNIWDRLDLKKLLTLPEIPFSLV